VAIECSCVVIVVVVVDVFFVVVFFTRFWSVFCDVNFIFLSGVEAVLVCRCLASIAAHSPGTWSHVSPTLLDYLNDKTDQHHRIIVSWQNTPS